jgi:hypothetical protein
MAKVIDPTNVIIASDIQIINGEEYRSYAIFARLKDENGNTLPGLVQIGQIGPDTGGQVTWIDDREVKIYDDFVMPDGSSIHDFLKDRIDRLRFDDNFQSPDEIDGD